MRTGTKVLATLAAMGATALGTGAAVLAQRRREELRRPQLAVVIPQPKTGGATPQTPATVPIPGAPNTAQASRAAELLKEGHAGADSVIRNSKGDRLAALEAYGRAWRMLGQASEALRAMEAVPGGKSPALAAELERLRLRLQSLQAQGAAILRKVPSWLTF